MSRLKKNNLNMDVWNNFIFFAKCTICESLKDLISKVGKNNPCVKKHDIKLKKHNSNQESCQRLYHT
jgi:hypothetical protein